MNRLLLTGALIVIVIWTTSHFATVDSQSVIHGAAGRIVIAPGIVGLEIGFSNRNRATPHFEFDILSPPSKGFGFNPPATRRPISETLFGWRQFYHSYRPFESAYLTTTFPIYYVFIGFASIALLLHLTPKRTEQADAGKPYPAAS